jgi:hypothetical protein
MIKLTEDEDGNITATMPRKQAQLLADIPHGRLGDRETMITNAFRDQLDALKPKVQVYPGPYEYDHRLVYVALGGDDVLPLAARPTGRLAVSDEQWEANAVRISTVHDLLEWAEEYIDAADRHVAPPEVTKLWVIVSKARGGTSD